MLEQAAGEAQQAGKLPDVTLPEITIERPQNEEHGDFASSFPLKLARAVGTKPMDIANYLVGLMSPRGEIESVSVAPPGFINFKINSDWLSEQVDNILTADNT